MKKAEALKVILTEYYANTNMELVFTDETYEDVRIALKKLVGKQEFERIKQTYVRRQNEQL